jgi:single-stranded DNA-binding protein
MNVVCVSGRVVRDPQLVKVPTAKGDVSKVVFIIKYVDRHGPKSQVSYFSCEGWGSGAEAIVKHFRDGSLIEVKGELRDDRWLDSKGNRLKKTLIRVERFWFPEREQEDDEDDCERNLAHVDGNV